MSQILIDKGNKFVHDMFISIWLTNLKSTSWILFTQQTYSVYINNLFRIFQFVTKLLCQNTEADLSFDGFLIPFLRCDFLIHYHVSYRCQVCLFINFCLCYNSSFALWIEGRQTRDQSTRSAFSAIVRFQVLSWLLYSPQYRDDRPD